jgi:hypothetical protein
MILNMFRASLCSSSGGQLYIYSIWYRHTLYAVIQCTDQERTAEQMISLNYSCCRNFNSTAIYLHYTTWAFFLLVSSFIISKGGFGFLLQTAVTYRRFMCMFWCQNFEWNSTKLVSKLRCLINTKVQSVIFDECLSVHRR